MGLFTLGTELTKNDQKKIRGGDGYGGGGGGGSTGGGSTGGGTTTPPPPSGSHTICSGGTYWIGCAPAYCSAAGHGTFQGCY